MRDPRERFSDRVRDYLRYRPGYPEAVLRFCERELGLGKEQVVADVGSGTGIFTRLLLEHGNTVYAIEPNAPMRAAAENELQGYRGFHSLATSAEATGLPEKSVDFVFSAQAFHWFDVERARAEFRRISRPGAWVVLIWNTRRETGSAFLEGYEQLLRQYGTDYLAVKHGSTRSLDQFFGAAGYRVFRCRYVQTFDFEALKGRLLSSSYVPAAGHPNHEPMLRALKRLFDEQSRAGTVDFEYETEVYCGRL